MQHPDEGTIHAWIDGELSPEQASEIETHVADCPECGAMVAEARGLVAASTRILTALDDVPEGVIPSVPDIAPAQIARRRWYQRTDLRAAAALLFVAGGSLLVVRQGVDTESTRAMIATTDKGRPAPAVGSEAAATSPAEATQQVMADATTSSSAATAPSAQSLKLQARDETQSLKQEGARARAADVANAPPATPLGRVDAPAPPMVAAPAEDRSRTTPPGVVEGRVIDKRSGQGLPGAQVLVEGTRLYATTDKDGSFKVADVPPGAQSLRVRRVGYDAVTVPLAKEARGAEVANVALAPSSTMLEEAVVTGVATAPAVAKVGAAGMNKTIAAAPLRVVRADSTAATKRTIYEVSKGVEVTLTESPVETVGERNAAARQKAAAPQSSAAPAAQAETKQRANVLSGRAAGADLSAPTPALNSISWTERGRRFVLTGRLTTKDLEALKARLVQARR
ncbi:MAG: carboxypeptidase-like regulatory domain-containing protein [Gemmatimonadota bacterium]|nr:carboxypeptidase-like regulatory domain-containing protein [Gemmatimonadota bacterium]